MKKIGLLFLVLCFTTLSKAQFISIPDNTFRTRLQQRFPECFDINGMMDTTCPAILNLTELDCGDWGISSLEGIQYFKSLTYLDCIHNQLTTLPQLPKTLTYLNCLSNQLGELPALPNSLGTLDCTDNPALFCLPQLPATLTALYIDTTVIHCLPNQVNGLTIYNNGTPATVNVCGSNNINGCIVNDKYVSIPDSSFREYLKTLVPDCFNGEDKLDTTCTAISSIKGMNIGYSPGSFLNLSGIRYFKALTQLSAVTSTVDISELPNSLVYISLTESAIEGHRGKLPDSLRAFNCFSSAMPDSVIFPVSITSISLGNAYSNFYSYNFPLLVLPSNLRSFNCAGNDFLTSLPALPDSLGALDCSANNALSCLPKLPSKLTTLYIDSKVTCLPNNIVGLKTYVDQQVVSNYPVCNVDPPCTPRRTCTWIGSAKSIWENPNNWSCGLIPGPDTDVIINNATVTVSVTNAIAYSVTLGSGAKLTVNPNLTLTVLH